MRHVRSTTLALATATVGGAFAFAPLASAESAAAALQDDALVIHSAGFDALLPDERDAVLRQVLALLPDRLLELHAEAPDFPELPEPMVRLIAAGLGSPMTLSFGLDDPNAGPPFHAQLAITPDDPAVANQLAGMLMDMGRGQGMEFQPTTTAGLQATPAPFGEMVMGVTPVDGAPTFFLGANTSGADIPAVTNHGLPDGVTPAFAMHYDTRQLAPVIEQMMAQQGEAIDPAFMEQMGIGGENGMRGTVAMGYAADRSHTMIVLEDYARLAEQMGLNADQTIPLSEFRAVPADATFVQVSSFDLSSYADMMEQMSEAAGAPGDIWGQIEAEVGINPRTDLLDHLGDTITVYRSDATGGGGIMSTVGLVGLGNPDRVAQTHAKLVRMFNEEATPAAQGYVSIRPWQHEGHDLFTLSFNGIPIPLQLTWGIQGSHLVMAASPQAVVRAMGQVAAPQRSILDRTDVADMAGGSFEGLVSFQYVDTPRAAARGYAAASFVTTALANLVRSPRPEARDRDPGMPMPSFDRFTRNIAPMVGVGRWRGDDFITHYQGDRSAVVMLASGLDSIGGLSGIAAAGVLVGLMAPALEDARENAREIKSMAMVREIAIAIAIYWSEREGQAPVTLFELVENGFFVGPMESPYGPIFDGPDYGYRAVRADVPNPSTTVHVVDRAMLWELDRTAVGFADGHVETLEIFELAELLKRPENEGAAKTLQIDEWLSWYDD